MVSNTLSALALAIAAAEAATKGFNYGSTNTAGAPLVQADFEALMNRANSLQGTSGFNSARLYTMIQSGTTNSPIEAIPAAISTKTSLLLGMWASAGQADFSNEIAALQSAISQYPGLADMVVGLSVGSEDLYRDSVTGIENNDGVGVGPSVIVDYIGQVKSAIQGTALSGIQVGHVDTWDAWTNGSNSAVISAADWLGVDSYPYFETTVANAIGAEAKTAFFNSYDATKGVAGGKPVWITETGWPVSGPTSGQAVASVANAETYWQDVGCEILGDINTWWYTLQDAMPTTPSPSFGIIGSDLSSAPLYDLTCKASGSGTGSSSASTASTATSGKTSTATGSTATGGSGAGKTSTAKSTASTSLSVASGKPSPSSNGTAPVSSMASASGAVTGTVVPTVSPYSSATADMNSTAAVTTATTGSAPSSTPTQPIVNAASTAGSAMGAAILAVFALVAAL